MLSKETPEGTATLPNHQQLEIDEQRLMYANLTILGLTETNQHLKCRNKEYEFKLNAVITQSDKLIDAYENELTSKIELIELYKANCEASHLDYQAHVSELEVGVTMLQQMLLETVDTCEYLEVKLHANEEKHRRELDEKDEIIAMLKQELKYTNPLKADARENDEQNKKDTEHGIETLNVENCCLKKDVSYTETQRIIEKIEKDLQDKKRDYDELLMQIKYLTDNVDKLLIEPSGTNFKSNVPNVDEASQNVLAELEKPNQTLVLPDLIPKIQQIKLSESNLHSKVDNGSSSILPYRMKLRSKKRARTDMKNEGQFQTSCEVILLSDNEEMDDEINVCDDDDDCVPARTQADELRYVLFR